MNSRSDIYTSIFALILLNSCQQNPDPSVHLPFTPQTVVVDGKRVVYYELDVVNTLEDSITLTNLDIHHDDRPLLSRPAQQMATKVVLGPQDTATFYIELVTDGEDKSLQLSHHFTANALSGHDTTTMSFDYDVEVITTNPVAIGAPLSGGPWAAVYDPAWPRGHRRVKFPGASKEFVPGRFAIDFIRLDSSGRYAHDDENQIANWFGYRNDVLAVADGFVVGTRDDFPESPTLEKHPRYPAEQATGNYIALEIAPSVIVFYEHLKPGSIRVTKGQQISKGDIIAQLGFTGQSTGPHLHLHVANDSAPLLSEGLAFVFDEFQLVGRYEDFSTFGKVQWKEEPVSIRHGERPAVNSVVRFSE